MRLFLAFVLMLAGVVGTGAYVLSTTLRRQANRDTAFDLAEACAAIILVALAATAVSVLTGRIG